MSIYKPLFPKKPNKGKADVDSMIFQAGKNLRMLKERYRVVLEKELMIGRENAKKGEKNSGNYARIGIAYYSLNIINAVQQRLQEIENTRELMNAMGEMSLAVGMVNKLGGQIGKMNPKTLIANARRMGGASSGAGRDLIRTLEGLSKLKLDRPDTVSIESLVSNDLIERLIKGEDVDGCVRNGDGISRNFDDLMSDISDGYREETMQQSEADKADIEPTMDEINRMVESLKSI